MTLFFYNDWSHQADTLRIFSFEFNKIYGFSGFENDVPVIKSTLPVFSFLRYFN